MNGFEKIKSTPITKGFAVFFILLAVSVLLTTCDSPLGFGDQIDFEPPVLTLDRVPNPWYVNSNVTLTGTVIDNVKVDKIIVRDTTNPERIFAQAQIMGSGGMNVLQNWQADLVFTEEDNNKKINAEIIAWDKMENSGDMSRAFVSFIVDIRPPMFEEPVIQRSLGRTAPLRAYESLLELEESDPLGYNIQNVELYQNGTFWIDTKVQEDETYARSVKLFLYDVNNDNEGEEIYKSDFDNSNPFAPRWTIKESDIITAGNTKGLNYTSILESGGRIYLRITLVAYDLAGNEGRYDFKREDYGYLCFYRKADMPKALLAGGIGEYISPGTVIPVDIFDDDTLAEAWIDLLTISQFQRYNGNNDAERLNNIKTKIAAGEPVENWKAEYGYDSSQGSVITNKITGSNLESTTIPVSTGQNTSDCGEFKLVAFVKDRKSAPHDISDSSTMAEPVWGCYVYNFTVVDKNSALIVIDTVNTESADYDPAEHKGNDPLGAYASSGNSPEESTFPRLPDGHSFVLSGYTLNENSDANPGEVKTFRIAWIPFELILNASSPGVIISQVEDAIKKDESQQIAANYPAGVQFWTLPTYQSGRESYFVIGSPEYISGIRYIKQTFKKKFDVLGAVDDLKPGYRNFTRDITKPKGHAQSTFENEDKYFVLYAVNTNGSETIRTIRLLGNKNPPELKVYDLTNVQALSGITGNESDTDNYQTITSWVKSQSNLEIYEANPFMTYPQGSVYKLYVASDKKDGVNISSLAMWDASSGSDTAAGHIDPVFNDITFVKSLPDISLNVFKFDAENQLDNRIQVMRTIAVTNTSKLTAIITPLPSGTYGQNNEDGTKREIMLRAQFSAPVMVRSTNNSRPRLNIRYETGGEGSEKWTYTSVPWSQAQNYNTSYVYLDFPFEVPTGANGRLQSVDQSIEYDSTSPSHTAAAGQNDYRTYFDRPVYLNRALIVDAEREDNVFLPGKGETGYILTWKNNPGNLQGGSQDGTSADGKEILLDGIIPKITHFRIGSKGKSSAPDNYTGSFVGDLINWHYFNSNDTLTFEIFADKDIRVNGNPLIQLRMRRAFYTAPEGTQNLQYVIYYASYERPVDDPVFGKGIMFTIDARDIDMTVNDAVGMPAGTNLNHGVVTQIAFITASGGIIDTSGNYLENTISSRYIGTALVIDNQKPASAIPALGRPGAPAAPVSFYNYNPVLTLPALTNNDQEPWGFTSQYSLDGGLKWVNYPDVNPDWTDNGSGQLTIKSGRYILVTRRLDAAGNESALSPEYDIEIESEFPKLLSMRIQQPRGIYKSADTLNFILEFERPVITNNANAYIIITDWERKTYNANNNYGDVNVQKVPVVLQPDLSPAANIKANLTFTWNIENKTKTMDSGITVAGICLAGVQDLYGNTMEALFNTPVNFSGSNPVPRPSGHTVQNLNGQQHEVLTWPPTLVEEDCIPRSGGKINDNRIILQEPRKVITLTFSHRIVKEMGNIYIRPYGPSGNFPIPPVFPTEGYLDDDGTYIPGFMEVYSSSNIDDYAAKSNNTYTAAILRHYLRASTHTDDQGRMLDNAYHPYNNNGIVNAGITVAPANRRADAKGKSLTTGLDYGPYRLNTQGLVQGAGYAANEAKAAAYNAISENGNFADTSVYNGKAVTTSADATNWNPAGSDYMIPDTRTKYVLDFNYGINDTTAAVNNIRLSLNAARYRWRELNVHSGNVDIKPDGRTVVITLDTALAKGFMWEIGFDEGAFVDRAGNKVEEIKPGSGEHWFWTAGVQIPVIRVDRRSMDYRTAPDRSNTVTQAAPGNYNGIAYINSFDTVAFRAESETPGAVIQYGTLLGKSQRAGDTGTLSYAAIETAWTGAVGTTTAINKTYNWDTWNTAAAHGSAAPAADPNTMGTWVYPNLIRRAIYGKNLSVGTVNGVPNTLVTNSGIRYAVTQNGVESIVQGIGSFWGFRSYNRDAAKTELDGLTLSQSGSTGSVSIGGGTVTYLRASKNYIVATATVSQGGAATPSSQRGYEGIFKTVIAMNSVQSTENKILMFSGNGNQPYMILGSNKMGDASIAGFPLQLATDDYRYLKVLNHANTAQMYWVTTEIVSPWYATFTSSQNQGGMNARPFLGSGDTGSFVSGSYGDLSYTYKQDVFGTNAN